MLMQLSVMGAVSQVIVCDAKIYGVNYVKFNPLVYEKVGMIITLPTKRI